ncbi:hypothetical protein SAMD00019534_027810, partial [Acytostelium subglobosum LB1]|uniref:hypothetical protein n=1 Tax=Acytostelium subglobosum LB1 TaxID=1410327 RepID=UPI000644D7F1
MLTQLFRSFQTRLIPKIIAMDSISFTSTTSTTTTTNIKPKPEIDSTTINVADRCPWLGKTPDPLYLKYHDTEWGYPERDPIKLFEKICLEGQQCGLSWFTILKKREEYRRSFHNFNPVVLANFTESDVDRLMKNEGIIRNRSKINAIIKNAKAFNVMRDSGEDFSKFIWSFVNDKPIDSHRSGANGCSGWPTRSEHSDAMAVSLKKKGFVFIGTTTCYAFMQSNGLINDHAIECHRHPSYKIGNRSSLKTIKQPVDQADQIDVLSSDDDEQDDIVVVVEDVKPKRKVPVKKESPKQQTKKKSNKKN